MDISNEIIVQKITGEGEEEEKRGNQSCRGPRKWLQNGRDSKVFLILAKEKNVYDASFLSSIFYVVDAFFISSLNHSHF